MPNYVVAYDLHNEVRRPPIVDEVKTTPFARLSESAYAIQTQETVAQVHARFAKHLDTDDDFYVISISRPWTGYGPRLVIDWLNWALGPGSLGAPHKPAVRRPPGQLPPRPRIPRS